GKERVIAAKADVRTRMEFGAALTDKNLAAEHRLAAKALHAETTTGRVTTVARRAACFFVSHDALLFLAADGGDFDVRFSLTVTDLAAIGVAAALLEHRDLVALLRFDERAGDGEAREILAELHAAAVARHQHITER